LPLLLAAGGLWLFLAAIPALADGGPHVMNANNGTLGLNADGCAGCHRVHTAQGPLLLKAANETDLCLSCHGAAVAGATTDVMTGIQYRLTTSPPYLRNGDNDPAPWDGVQLGALRAGGYDQARIGDPARIATSKGGGLRTKVAVGAAEDVNSAHLDLDGAGGVVARNVAWGNGQNDTGIGPTVELSCVACHNPHGNGQYRILRPIPELDAPFVDADAITYDILASDAENERVYLVSSPPLLPGDTVTIAGHSNGAVNGDWSIVAINNSTSTGVYVTLTGTGGPLAITSDGAGGTLRITSGRIVTDAALPVLGDVRNYTVIDGNSTALLYASQVLAGGSRADVIGIAASDATTDEITTAAAHGLSVGQNVTVASHGETPAIGTKCVSFVDGTGMKFRVYAAGCAGADLDITAAGGANLGWVSRSYTVASYAATDGDYFHRFSSWFTGVGNDNPVDTNGTGGNVQLFNDQINNWCSACHTRYYAYLNPEFQFNIASSDDSTDAITTSAPHGLIVGNDVAIAGHDAATLFGTINGMCDVATVPSATTFTCTGVDITTDGTAVGTVTEWGASYEAARPGDDIYNYQHRTRANRACTTCHVAHGSNAQMTGTFSSTFPYPGDAITSNSSRLLKVDNRGTCQGCHDPTGTIPAGSWTGLTTTSIP
jgi:predicted CXXCH cytochrome family protein